MSEDLINFSSGSPVLSRTSPNTTQPEVPEVINLIDYELPIFEEKLSENSTTPNVVLPKIDVEDILITIEDDEPEVPSTSSTYQVPGTMHQVPGTVHQVPGTMYPAQGPEVPGPSTTYQVPSPIYQVPGTICKSTSENVLHIPYMLDDRTCASCENLDVLDALKDLDEVLNSCVSSNEDESTIEECLQDLDNYLRNFDMDERASNLVLQIEESSADLDEQVLRQRLEKMEANYSRFLSACASRELVRSSSTTNLPQQSFQHGDRLRATVVGTTPDRTSATDAEASADICTGSVVPVNKELRLSMRRLQPLGESSTVRPMSAPSSVRTSTRSRRSQGVEGGVSSESSRRHSLDSSVTSLESVESNGVPEEVPTAIPPSSTRRPCERPTTAMPSAESPLGQWPHSLSSMMACLGCTLGLFNVCRFAILTVHFGANFIFQFVFLSMVFGLPLYTLQLCLGQQLGSGVVDMWRISPLFQGVGIALLLAQMLIGLYSIVGVSWMFVFFRDSFITRVDRYRWAEPFIYYRDALHSPNNGTYKLSETIPDYFNGVVLQRHHLSVGNHYGTIKFQVAFNLAVVWMIVFVSLSKGLRSYGKVVYVFTLLPIFGTFVLCAKILGMMPPEYINIIFPETTWNEFFLNPKSWLAAAQEVFLTWGVLGAAVMQIASHNKHKHLLQRDSSLVAIITFTILLLVAFLANTCVQILKSFGYNYLPDSYERMSSYVFLRPLNEPLPANLASLPVRYMPHNSFLLGEKIVRPGVDPTFESGYQALRLATELIPATFAVIGSEQLSPFWAVLFYFILILFGIAQQLAIWHTVITGVMAIKAKFLKSWETTITLFSCIFGYLLGLPMATEFGIYVVYFLDYTVGGIWWLLVIILLEIVAVFMVRGRPYSGDTVVTALFASNNHPCLLSWAPALLSFTWNVILPVALAVLCIATFKNGHFRELFVWHHVPSAEYWPLWARQLGSMIQLVPILLVPLVAVIQSYRYISNGPSDILERIQLLYRPPIGEHMTDIATPESVTVTNHTATSPSTAASVEDPPPKYTPPPSYTTATGARLAKFLRHSIRRSVRRILGESSRTNQEPPANPPPDYNAVLVEMNHREPQQPSIGLSTLERLRNVHVTPGSPTLTAAEVASILRSSFRRSTVRRGRVQGNGGGVSAENLVEYAVPIGETSLAEDGHHAK